MMERIPKQQSVEIRPIPFQNIDFINYHLNSKGEIVVALQPKSPLNYVVYPISEEKSSILFNLLIHVKQNRRWGLNYMNDGK